MKKLTVVRLSVLSLVAVLAACTSNVDLEAERWLLFQADEAYTEAMDAGDVAGIVALYADDATRYPPDGDPASGLEAMRAFAERVASTPGFALKAWPISLEVSGDATVGHTLNHLEITMASEDGAPMVEWLRDAHRWRKEADGSWKIVEDVWQVMEVAPSVMSLLSGPDVEVTSLGFVDLMGAPADFDWEAAGDLPSAVPEGAMVPVQIYTVRWDGGEDGSSTRLVIASADTGGPAFLLDEVVQMVGEDGGGYAPLDDIRFEAGDAGEPLVLVVSQGGFPGRDDGGVMPGAPSQQRWTLVDGVFQRME